MRCLSLLIIAAIAAGAAESKAAEQGATIALRDLEILDGVPGRVLQAIDHHGRGGRIAQVEAKKDGEWYEVQLRQGEEEWQLKIAADGTLKKDGGHEADLDQLPPKAKRAILEAAGADRVVDVDRKDRGGRAVWTAQIRGEQGSRTVRVDADGELR